MLDDLELASEAALWARRELSQYEQQQRRYALVEFRRQHAKELGSSTAGYCQRASAEGVEVRIDNQGRQYVKGVMRCGSVGCCPACSPTIRSKRAADIEAAVEAWQALGGEVWFLTLTIPHQLEDELADVLGDLRSMWREAWQTSGGRSTKAAIGLEGFIRAFEITDGANGWHPHLHALLFTRPGHMQAQRVINMWRSRWKSRGILDQWVPRVSLDLRQVEGTGLGEYLGKVNMSWAAGLELARSDAKSGRGLNTAQLLELASTGESRWVERWREYETSTKGLRWIEWSRGLRDKAITWQLEAAEAHRDHMASCSKPAQECEDRAHRELLGVSLAAEEESDEEAAAAELAGVEVARWRVPFEVWESARVRKMIGHLLQTLVAGQGEQFGCVRLPLDGGVSDVGGDARARAPAAVCRE